MYLTSNDNFGNFWLKNETIKVKNQPIIFDNKNINASEVIRE